MRRYLFTEDECPNRDHPFDTEWTFCTLCGKTEGTGKTS